MNQPSIRCDSCNLYYHVRCVYTDMNDGFDWYCFKCTGELFPFNHYVDDDEFRFVLFCHGNSTNYNRMLSLKLNPFQIDDQLHNARNEYSSLNNHNVSNKCSYLFDNNMYTTSRGDDFSILHINPRSLNKNIDSIHTFISSLNHTFTIIISMSETFDDNDSNLINLENYN